MEKCFPVGGARGKALRSLSSKEVFSDRIFPLDFDISMLVVFHQKSGGVENTIHFMAVWAAGHMFCCRSECWTDRVIPHHPAHRSDPEHRRVSPSQRMPLYSGY